VCTFKALNNEEEVFQSLSWKADGSVLATTSKDKKVRIWDPRANSVTHSADSHSSNRESVTTWLGASNRILTSGFDSVNFFFFPFFFLNREENDFQFHFVFKLQSRQRQVFVRDVRNFSQVEFSLVFDSSTGWVFLLPNSINSFIIFSNERSLPLLLF
jgi:coronin-7